MREGGELPESQSATGRWASLQVTPVSRIIASRPENKELRHSPPVSADRFSRCRIDVWSRPHRSVCDAERLQRGRALEHRTAGP